MESLFDASPPLIFNPRNLCDSLVTTYLPLVLSPLANAFTNIASVPLGASMVAAKSASARKKTGSRSTSRKKGKDRTEQAAAGVMDISGAAVSIMSIFPVYLPTTTTGRAPYLLPFS